MKVWLYYRLSRDEDEELNSLNNQRKIIYNFAVSNGHEVVGESFDDNVSGMHFNREGIDKIYEVVETGKIEAIIVKDLSRLGRHRTQTALFIDYLREHDVRVLSATENIDTFNENDDLIIGFKGLVNDFYARDGSRRVRTGYRQKQKEGIVTIPPFGYFKDKNTKKVVVVEEAAETVRLIFSAYVGGSGMKAIARTLNEQRRKTPALMQAELLNKRLPNTQDGILKKYLWDATMVARILRDESYIGTLICHKSERNKINKTFRFTDPEEQFRHENYLPMIVTCEIWEQAQALLAERKEKNVRAGTNRGILRYGGLLRCKDCGRTFIGKRIKLKSGERVAYVCDTYHRYGKEHCSSHMVDEETLDRLIGAEILRKAGVSLDGRLTVGWAIRERDADSRFVKELLRSIQMMKDKYNAQSVLIPFHYEEDGEVCRHIAAQLPDDTAVCLNEKYLSEDMLSIIGNMDTSIFLGGKEPTTLKELAAVLGKETIDTYNTGESRGRETSHSLNYQKLGKELMSQDELAVMDGGKCILQLRGVRPFLSDKYDITKHPNFKYTADADDKNAFDIEAFLSARLKLKPNEVCDVYEVDTKGA